MPPNETISFEHQTTKGDDMRTIDEIIIHCTATPEGREVTVEELRRWHRAKGWADVGYHYIIYLDGSVHEGRPVWQAGAHTSGHNAHSIGVCYVGGCDAKMQPKDTRTALQKASMLNLLKKLLTLYPGATLHGHREYAAKACPSFDVKEEYKELTNK